jgi:transposase InsO family protein
MARPSSKQRAYALARRAEKHSTARTFGPCFQAGAGDRIGSDRCWVSRPRPSVPSCAAAGCPRLADIDRPTGLPVRRYEVCHPGVLVHQDHKKLGRIPDGGGHRMHGRSTEMRRKPKLGYDHFEVIVDDRTRRSVVVDVPDESGGSAAAALTQALAVFAADGITVERVLTDNGLAYRSNAYRAVLGGRRHSRTRPYRPQTNGKAERFIGTLLREWAYARPYRSNTERLEALPNFVDFYNQFRPHRALGGLSPSVVVNNVRGDHS